MTEPEYKVKCRAFRWGALKGTPTARLRRALGEAEPVWGAMRRFAPVASQTVLRRYAYADTLCPR